MNMRVYEKTRYQNIYRNIKNKNYVIMMSKPVKTSISRIDSKKIVNIDDAIKIRDNYLLKKQKGLETIHKESIDFLWKKYIHDGVYIKKWAYNTITRKNKMANRYIINKITKPISKLNKSYLVEFIDKSECSLKQKNYIIKELKAFFNWCISQEYIMVNPLFKVSKYKIEKSEMKYWLPNELKNYLDTLEEDINSNNLKTKETAYRTKMLTLIGFVLGDRIGETRALCFSDIDKEKKIISIKHSINYDRNSSDFLSNTKTYSSQRQIDISDKLINEFELYKSFLINECNYPVSDNSIILFNWKSHKPFSDVALRKVFYRYCNKANVKRIRMYDLRHTYVATMMSEGQQLYYISSKLGHTNYNTTVNKYGHLTDEIKKEIAVNTDKYY